MPHLGRVGLVFVVYFVTAKLGLMMDAVSGFATLVWPPTGISLAALLLYGYRLWPGITLGAFLVNYVSGAPFFTACGMGIGNTLEALVGAYLLRRVVGFQNAMPRLRDVMGLIVFAALLSTTVSATFGVASLWLGGVVAPDAWLRTWMAWWLGDVLGNLVVAPLLLAWASRPQIRLRGSRALEAAGLTAVLLSLGFLIFFSSEKTPPHLYSMPYLIYPVLIWAALRFGLLGTVTSTFAISAISIWGAARGLGPFRIEALSQSLTLLQSFMGVLAVTGLVLTAVVTELSQAEKRSRSTANELEMANFDLTTMLDIMAHDLKEPFRSIESYSDLLKERYADRLDGKALHYLQRIILSSARMRRLLDDIQYLSRTRRMELKKSPVDAEEIVRAALERLERRIRETGARVEVHPDLSVLQVDRTMAVEAVYNLMSNAMKFTRDDKPPDIEIAPYRGAEGAGLAVLDRGPGVPPAQAEKIFILFERGVGREVEGSGAGLAIVHQVAERHGGKAWVRPRQGGGSEFIITFGGWRPNE